MFILPLLIQKSLRTVASYKHRERIINEVTLRIIFHLDGLLLTHLVFSKLLFLSMVNFFHALYEEKNWSLANSANDHKREFEFKPSNDRIHLQILISRILLKHD